MSKITNLEQKTFNNKPSGFKVTLDDGRSGNLEEKQSDKGLRNGDEVVVTEIPYTSKAGNKSTLYGLRLVGSTQSQSFAPTTAQQPSKPQIHVGAGKSKEEMKSLAAIELIKPFIGLFLDGKIESGEIAIKHKEFLALLSSEIDDIYSGK
jgi:hypothetical protein